MKTCPLPDSLKRYITIPDSLWAMPSEHPDPKVSAALTTLLEMVVDRGSAREYGCRMYGRKYEATKGRWLMEDIEARRMAEEIFEGYLAPELIHNINEAFVLMYDRIRAETAARGSHPAALQAASGLRPARAKSVAA